MLVAALLVFLSMGSGAAPMAGAIDQMESRAQAVEVTEPVRKDILNVINRMKKTTQQYAKNDDENQKTIIEYFENEEHSGIDIEHQLDANYQQRIEYQNKMLALRFELKNKVNKQQWDEIVQP